jgi:NAD(P)-dependent dehydrogenase (short-subunit alcohol dehydrogenase family)
MALSDGAQRGAVDDQGRLGADHQHFREPGDDRRRGFSPYGPSKAALESETIIWAQDLAETGVTVNALLPGGATLTGMIPDGVPDKVRSALLDPSIMVPPLLWLASPQSVPLFLQRVSESLS